MRKTKFISILATVFVLCFFLNTVAFATGFDEPPTGTVDVICDLNFGVGYTGNSFKGDIAVILKDIATDKEYQFLLKAEKGYNASEVYGIRANTTYNVTISYPNDDKFEIVNSDGSEIKSYHATSTGLYLNWHINENEIASNEITSNESSSEDTHGEEVSAESKTAEEVLNTFVEKTKFIEDDKNFNQFLGNWSGAVYEKSYLEIEGNTQESWNSMSIYEQACYSLLLTLPKSCILGRNRNLFAKDRNTFLDNLMFAKSALGKISNGDIVYDAIVEVWDWHWYNWKNKRTFVNLFENTSYDSSDVKENSNDFELSDDEISEIIKDTNNSQTKNFFNSDSSTNLTSKERRNELSSPKNFLSIILDNIVTLIILIVVGVVFLVSYLKNKKNNYEDYDE